MAANLKESIPSAVSDWQKQESNSLVLRPRSLCRTSGDFNDIDLVQPRSCDKALLYHLRNCLDVTIPGNSVDLEEVPPFQRRVVLRANGDKVVLDLQDSIILRGCMLYSFAELSSETIVTSDFTFVDEVRSDVTILMKELVHVGNLNKKTAWIEEVRRRYDRDEQTYRLSLDQILGSGCADRVARAIAMGDLATLNGSSWHVRWAFLHNRMRSHPKTTLVYLLRWATTGVVRRLGS